jgi:hypothetical protein
MIDGTCVPDISARERPPPPGGGVSRFGVIPKPTVTVRMEENGIGVGCGWPAFDWHARAP